MLGNCRNSGEKSGDGKKDSSYVLKRDQVRLALGRTWGLDKGTIKNTS